jgi:hypothetical protein
VAVFARYPDPLLVLDTRPGKQAVARLRRFVEERLSDASVTDTVTAVARELVHYFTLGVQFTKSREGNRSGRVTRPAADALRTLLETFGD